MINYWLKPLKAKLWKKKQNYGQFDMINKYTTL